MTEQEYINRLNTIYRYARESDGKVFKITFYGHWTDLRSEDGETRSVGPDSDCLGGVELAYVDG